MSSTSLQPPLPVAPMPAGRRYRIATASSVGFHLAVLTLISLLATRVPSRPDVLIPIELTVAERSDQPVVLGGGGRPDAPPRESSTPTTTPKPQTRRASSPGGTARAAPAPPRVLTAKTGVEPSGPVGAGSEATGPGGEKEVPAGPSYGPSIVGGPLPIYPKDAMDRGISGTVTLVVAVGSDGAVTSVLIAKSSGHKMLDDAAVRAVQKGWAFKGGMDKGKPAPGKVTVTFVFSGSSVRRE